MSLMHKSQRKEMKREMLNSVYLLTYAQSNQQISFHAKVRQQNGKRNAKFQLLLCRQLLISSTLKILITIISECHELCFMSQLECCDASRWKVVALISDTMDVSNCWAQGKHLPWMERISVLQWDQSHLHWLPKFWRRSSCPTHQCM